jgi:uncharacterized membrane protein YebE (DUF533 family)
MRDWADTPEYAAKAQAIPRRTRDAESDSFIQEELEYPRSVRELFSFTRGEIEE